MSIIWLRKIHVSSSSPNHDGKTWRSNIFTIVLALALRKEVGIVLVFSLIFCSFSANINNNIAHRNAGRLHTILWKWGSTLKDIAIRYCYITQLLQCKFYAVKDCSCVCVIWVLFTRFAYYQVVQTNTHFRFYNIIKRKRSV